jgi:hypothetical protein
MRPKIWPRGNLVVTHAKISPDFLQTRKMIVAESIEREGWSTDQRCRRERDKWVDDEDVLATMRTIYLDDK